MNPAVMNLATVSANSLSPWGHGLLNVLVCVGMLVVVPLGLRLIDGSDHRQMRRLWFAGAIPGAASLLLPRGWLAAAFALAYVLATALLLARIPARLLVDRVATPRVVAVCAALIAPMVASCSLAAERAGYRLFGFDLDVLALTVAHFHYAGFAAALVAGLVCRLSSDGSLGQAAALSVPVGIATVFVGFFTNDWVELAGALSLTVGMWLTGWLVWHQAIPVARDRATRALLATSALVLGLTMVLALDWALGETTGLAHLSLSWMVATHGVANALGFALCGIVAWRRLRVNAV